MFLFAAPFVGFRGSTEPLALSRTWPSLYQKPPERQDTLPIGQPAKLPENHRQNRQAPGPPCIL